MDPFTKSRTEAPENKAFEEASVEVDLVSSDWFDHQTKRFPNKTPKQLTNRSIDPIDERLMEESSNEQMLKQAEEVEEELQIWLGKITNGDEVLSLRTEKMDTVKVLSRGTQGMEIVVPEVVTQIRGGKNMLKDVTTVTAGKRTEEPGTFTTGKKNIWSEEEHRFD